jgi:O-antigen/teichoic acid export membrane protein
MPEAKSPPVPDAASPAMASARGVAWVGAAKVLFILSGLSIQLVVPRLLGSPERYGLLTAATTALAIVTNTLTTTLVQTTSKLASSTDPADLGAVEQASLRHGAALGVGIGALFALLAWPVATYLLRDPLVMPLLALGGLVIAAYAVYSTSIGILNGRRTFARQARLDATFSTVRALAWIGGAALGLGALGVMSGFAAGAVLIAAIAFASVRVASSGRAGSTSLPDFGGRFLRTLLPLAAMQLALNGVLQLDVEVLKGLLAHLAVAAGSTALEAAERASFEVGCYRGAQQLAFLPYQLSIAVTLVLFPVVAHARQAKDEAAARAATNGALRFTLLALVAMEAPLVAGGANAMRLILPDEFAAGADALPVLALGQVAFALFALCATVLAGAGELRAATTAAVLGLVAMLGAAAGGVLLVGIEGPVRIAAAAGSALGAAVALGVALRGLSLSLGVGFPWLVAARALASGVAAVALGRMVPGTGIVATAGAVVVAMLVYALGLTLLGELGRAELALIRRVARRT